MNLFKKKNKNRIVKKTSTEIINEKSPFAFVEAYKSLRTNLSFMTFDGEVKVISVTSALSNEGKSTVSINLAQILAQADKKVLLIDGDLRMPSLQKYLRVRQDVSNGFSSVLAGKATIEESVYKHNKTNVDVMLAGPIPPNAAELFGREKVAEIFDELKELYDYVIVDTPPVGVVSDAAIISKYVDGALMVVRQNFTDKDVVKTAFKSLENSGVKILGIVFNNYISSKNAKSNSVYDYQYQYGSDR